MYANLHTVLFIALLWIFFKLLSKRCIVILILVYIFNYARFLGGLDIIYFCLFWHRLLKIKENSWVTIVSYRTFDYYYAGIIDIRIISRIFSFTSADILFESCHILLNLIVWMKNTDMLSVNAKDLSYMFTFVVQIITIEFFRFKSYECVNKIVGHVQFLNLLR